VSDEAKTDGTRTDVTTTGVRPAEAGDAAVIARIHRDARAQTMPYLPPQKRSHEQVTAWVADVMLQECRVWVAVRGAEVVGFAALEGDLLEHLYLRPDLRRQGIGTLLLDVVRSAGPDGVSLHVFEQNTDARAFYQRHGFTVVATGDGSDNMERLPDLTMRWTPLDA
jgi:ribosomal protein S18 acetylase RimI-like enzyme